MLTIKNPSTHDWAGMSLADVCEGNAMDTHYTLRIYKILEEKMRDDPLYKFMERVLMPVVHKFGYIEYEGVDVDPTRHNAVGRAITTLNNKIEDSMYGIDAVDNTETFSGQDILNILYLKEGGLELYPAGHTEKKKPSTDAKTLQFMLDAIDEVLSERAK